MDAVASPEPTPLLDDQPSSVDLLNFGQYAAALRAVVLNPQTRTPFVIGIYGRWGTGKTTLMRMVESALEPAGVSTVWFSAWPYAQEQEIWAAFLQALTIRLSRRLPLLQKVRLSLGMFGRSLAWDRLLGQAPRYAVRLGLLALPAAAGALLAPLAQGWLGSLLAPAGLAGSFVLALWYAAKAGASAARAGAAPDFSLYRSADFERHVGFLEQFRTQFAQIVEALPGERRRLVVLVDDLDRCNPERALQLLDAIKVFLDVPGCVFVIGVDPSVLTRALAAKYPDDAQAQREYLGKIVQLGFHLPPLTPDDLSSYLRRLSVRFPDERCRDVFLAALGRNPREIKRVINGFSLYWTLAGASGSLLHPVRLAKVVAIQQTAAPLFALLRERPEWLATLERAMLAQAGMQVAEDPAGAADETSILGGTGAAVPPAVSPFLSDPALLRLLLLHADASPDGSGSGFAFMTGAELSRYFTLTPPVPQEKPAGGLPPAPPPVADPFLPGNFDLFAPAGLAPAPPADLLAQTGSAALATGYRIIGAAGFGASSEALLAEDRMLGRRVVIKRIAATLASDPEWLARFRREMEALARLDHPNIVRLLDVHPGNGQPGDPPFYVMEYIEGSSLRAWLDRSGRLTPAEACALFLPLFDALSYLHARGVTHRDIKPSAIHVTAQGQPRLLDFGLAIESGTDALTQVGTVIGTPAYMSPEQFRGEPVDGRSDLFSLGAVIYECLTGEKAFQGGVTSVMQRILSGAGPVPPSTLAPGLPASLNGFIGRILAGPPQDRFPDAAAAKTAFRAALGCEAVSSA